MPRKEAGFRQLGGFDHIDKKTEQAKRFSPKFGRQRHEWLVGSANLDVSVADGKLEAIRIAQCP